MRVYKVHKIVDELGDWEFTKLKVRRGSGLLKSKSVF